MTGVSSRRVVFLLLVLIGLGGTATDPAHAAGDPASAMPPTFDLAAVTAGTDLASHLQLLVDAARRLDPEQAMAAPGWSAGSPSSMAPGVSDAAFWLRVHLANRGGEPVTRWLVMGSPRLEKIDVYQFHSPGGAVVAQQGGTARPLDRRQVIDRLSAFPVSLQPGQEATVVVRVESRSLMQLGLRAWEPLAWREARATEDLVLLLPVAVILTLAVSLVMVSLSRWEPALIVMSGWLVAVAVHELAYQGFIYRYLLSNGGEWAVRMPPVTSVMARLFSLGFVFHMLEMWRLRGWRWILPGVALVFLAALADMLWGDMRRGVIWSNIGTLIYVAAGFVCLVAAWYHRHRRVALVLVGSTSLLAANIPRVMHVKGVAADAGLVFEPTLAYMVVVGVALVYGVIRSSVLEHRQAVANREALLASREADRKRLERAVEERTWALSAALEEAQEANRAKRDFLARVSHDLRSPLTAIIGYAEVIVAAGRQDADNGRIIRRSARHLLSLLNDLIDYARGVPDGALEQVPIYTAALLERVVTEGRAQAVKYGNAFDFRIASALPQVVEADMKRLHQVLENLLSNAAKFTRDGNVQFSVEVVGHPDLRPGSVAQFTFTVRDTGPGIAPSALRDIFQPFVRLNASERREGLGLGLTIANQWVQRMGGEIIPSSMVGMGTTMQVRLGLVISSEDALSVDAWVELEADLPRLDGRGLAIWVAEDSTVIRNLLVSDLVSGGFVVTGFADGAELVERALSASQPPALVLTDLDMPAADGRAVLASVRARWPDVPVVLLTATPFGHGDPSADGFSVVLQKPVSLSHLRQTVGELLGTLPQVSPPDPSGGPAAPPEAPVDPALRAHLRTLVRSCAISDIIDWAEEVAEQQPASRDFALRAKALAERTDLQSLAQLCD